MSKRLICVLLVAALLAGITYAAPFTVNATSELKASEECVALLKKYEGFRAKPYWDSTQYSVGYGTSFDMANFDRYNEEGISYEEAEGLLWGHINSKSSWIHKKITDKGHTLTQTQFDALVLFTYNVGIGWLNGSFLLDAILNNAPTDEIIYAMVLWCKSDRVFSNGLINRRLAEANLFLNGEYSRTPPENYNFVRFDLNGGTSDYAIQGYDMNSPTQIRIIVEPKYQKPNGDVYGFVGWFTERTGGTQVSVLDSSLGYGSYLYAHWEFLYNAPVDPDLVKDSVFGVVTAKPSLNIRSGPGTNYTVLNSYPYGQRVEILEQKTVGTTTWGRTNAGWISLEFVQLDEVESTEPPTTAPPTTEPPTTTPPTTEPPTTAPPTTEPPTTTPPTTEPPTTTPPTTEPPTTVPPTTVPPTTVPPTTVPPTTVPPTTNPPYASWVGKVWVDVGSSLRVRTGPGTSYPIVRALHRGDLITILEETTVNGVKWGRIDRGWISLEFVVDVDYEEPTVPPTTAPPATEPTVPPTTVPPTTVPPTTVPPTTVPPTTVPPTTVPPTTVPPTTVPPTTAPPTTVPPTTVPPTTVPPTTVPPTTAPTEPPVTEPVIPDTTGPWTGVVAVDHIRVRSGAGNAFQIIGYLPRDMEVSVAEKMNVNGTIWGRVNGGWICLDDVQMDGDSQENPSQIIMTVDTCSLRVRNSASLAGTIIGYLEMGDRVEILEQVTVDNVQWVRTGIGWVCLKYLK